MLTVEMFRNVQHNKTKKAKIVWWCVRTIFPASHHVRYNRATTRVRASRAAWTDVEQWRCVAMVRGSAVTGHSLSWNRSNFGFLHQLKSDRSWSPPTPEQIGGEMARGEGAEQCAAATLLSVKAVSAESKSSTVRFVMNGRRMPAGTHAGWTHVLPGSGV